MQSFKEYLAARGVEADLMRLLMGIAEASVEVRGVLQEGDTGYLGGTNEFGDEQLKLDVRADKCIAKYLEKSEVVSVYASEEQVSEVQLGEGRYAVAYDPVDGSSVVDASFAVGSIFGVWEGGSVVGKKGEEMVVACYSVYGSRFNLVLALAGEVSVFVYRGGEFVLEREKVTLEEEKNLYMPGGLHSIGEVEGYKDLVDYWLGEGYKLRYSGGMVTDVHHVLIKRGGIFTYPQVKLRLAFECAPMAYIVEAAGGKVVDEKGKRMLEKEIKSGRGRTGIILGSKKEVESVLKFLE